MYENGRQMNRYANKRKHIDFQKQKYGKQWVCYGPGLRTWQSLVNEYQDEPWPKDSKRHPLAYWRETYDSNGKSLCREQTNRRLRQQARELEALMLKSDEEELEDFDEAYGGGDYRRLFDYWWELW